jgi:hypothetical protein
MNEEPPEWLENGIAEAEDFTKTPLPPWWLILMLVASIVTLFVLFISSLQVGDETAAAVMVLILVVGLCWLRFI